MEALTTVPTGFLPSDVLYVSSHGKGGIVEIAEILSAAHVPVIASPDLDILNNKANCKAVVLAVGGIWTDEIEKNFNIATAEFRTPRSGVTQGAVKLLIDGVLSADESAVFDGESRDAVMAVLRADNPWSDIKKHGMSGFRASRSAADRLVELLADQGVVLVRVGELEGFAPSLGVAKGKSWLPAALAANAQESAEAAGHATRLAQSLLISETRAASADKIA